MASRKFTRRRFIGSAAAVTLAAPYLRTSHAAGSLSVGFWDHWVPGANNVLTAMCNEWAAKEKVDIKIDYIPSQGNKNMLTIAAEAQAKAGHDMLAFPTWQPADKGHLLEPVDDVMKAVVAANGAVSPLIEYLAKSDGKWIAIPATPGSQIKGPCGRIDLLKQHAGLDVQKMYPAGAAPDKALSEAWTWEGFLTAAQKCHKAGVPFGIGLGQTPDSVDTMGALFSAYGAVLVDAKGNVTVKSDAVREVLEYMKKLVAVLPGDVFAWDDASNNRWLVAGKGALIMNPPSAWAVAKRDAPKVAEQLWTFPSPRGPKGRARRSSSARAWCTSKRANCAASRSRCSPPSAPAAPAAAASPSSTRACSPTTRSTAGAPSATAPGSTSTRSTGPTSARAPAPRTTCSTRGSSGSRSTRSAKRAREAVSTPRRSRCAGAIGTSRNTRASRSSRSGISSQK
jgi:ABC-type glycerol-3-phosphate transport system substrate-binding protein